MAKSNAPTSDLKSKGTITSPMKKQYSGSNPISTVRDGSGKK